VTTTLGGHLDGVTTAALLDIPNHANPGDAAILLGELAVLRRLGVRVGYLADLRSFDSDHLHQRVADAPVLLHGGGNVGDVYPLHQAFRESFLASHGASRVVQLPQSVYFKDASAAARAKEVYQALSSATFLARDSVSQARVTSDLGIGSVLCPDSAFALVDDRRLVAGLPRGQQPLVYLMRTDREQVDSRDGGASVPLEDWDFTALQRSRLPVRVLSRAAPYLPPAMATLTQLSPRGNLVLARSVVRRAARQVARAEVVVTDRLHGMILACLLGVPHVAVDNLNGKVHAFHRDWLAGLPSSRRAADMDEAAEVAAELLGASGSRLRATPMPTAGPGAA
jgi:pyruvyl transferase EpsO